jgi:hypothetical protein
VELVLSAVDALVGHLTTAHRALVAAAGAVAAGAAAEEEGAARAGDACRFLLDPLRPALRAAFAALAAAALAAAETGPRRPAGAVAAAPDGGGGGGPLEPPSSPESLAAAMATFYRTFDALCRGLQPAHARALAAQAKPRQGDPAGAHSEAPATAPETHPGQSAKAAAAASAPAATTNAAPTVAGAAAAAAGAAPRAQVRSCVGVMSNFEVQAVNALVFSLLRGGRTDLPRLVDAAADLAERQALFS